MKARPDYGVWWFAIFVMHGILPVAFGANLFFVPMFFDQSGANVCQYVTTQANTLLVAKAVSLSKAAMDLNGFNVAKG